MKSIKDIGQSSVVDDPRYQPSGIFEFEPKPRVYTYSEEERRELARGVVREALALCDVRIPRESDFDLLMNELFEQEGL